ncbi:MAG: S1 family peptidase [Pseudomonadota bacterium]
MRLFLIFFLALALGFFAALFGERAPSTKSLFETHVTPLVEQVISPPAPEPVATSPLPLAADQAFHARAELDAFGIRPCFPHTATEPPTEQPWLTRDTSAQALFDRGAIPPSPDLTDYPGLIKIEGIRSLDGDAREHCAAVRIAEHWFLTAAHCLSSAQFPAPQITYDAIAITPSDDVRSDTTEVAPIRGAICHTAYGQGRQSVMNDFALFYLDDVSAFAPVTIAALETPEDGLIPFDFRRTYIAGWGKNGGGRYLQGGPVNVIRAGEALLIAERIGTRGPNVGDSGAPLYLSRETGPIVVGVLSQVAQDSVENGERSIYVRAKSMHDWITRTLAICEQDGRYVCGP